MNATTIQDSTIINFSLPVETGFHSKFGFLCIKKTPHNSNKVNCHLDNKMYSKTGPLTKTLFQKWAMSS
jgi:hypothetical protein